MSLVRVCTRFFIGYLLCNRTAKTVRFFFWSILPFNLFPYAFAESRCIRRIGQKIRELIMEEKKVFTLSEQEQKVVELMRGIDFGELRIVINNSKPIRVEEIKKSLQL